MERAVEQHNRRADAIVAREINLALPHELSVAQRRDLAHGFAWQIDDRYQVAVNLAIHRPNGQDPRNHHAHLLLTTNRLGPVGLGTKARELDPIATAKAGPGANAVEQLRQEWAHRANQALEHAGQSARIDHRTLKPQGLEQEPTRHLGPAAVAYERRTGTPSRRRAEMKADPDIQQKIAALTRDLEATRQRLTDLEEARRGRAQALAEERAELERRRQVPPARTERERIEHMTAKELAAEIQRLTPRPVEAVLQEHPEVIRVYHQVEQLRQQVKSATEAVRLARYEAQQWREEHGIRARLHGAGLSQHYLAERERIHSEQTQLLKSLTQKLEEADSQARQVADRLRRTLIAEQAPARTWIAELERLRQVKAAQEPTQTRQEQPPPNQRDDPARQTHPKAAAMRDAFDAMDRRSVRPHFPHPSLRLGVERLVRGPP